MGRREQNESYRAQILRRLEGKYRNGAPPEVLEAQKVIAKFRERQTKDREIESRLGLPLPSQREGLLQAVGSECGLLWTGEPQWELESEGCCQWNIR